MNCPEVMGPCCLISEEEVVANIKGLTTGKAAGPTPERRQTLFSAQYV